MKNNDDIYQSLKRIQRNLILIEDTEKAVIDERHVLTHLLEVERIIKQSLAFKNSSIDQSNTVWSCSPFDSDEEVTLSITKTE